MALSGPRNTERRGSYLVEEEMPLKTNLVFHQGALCAIDATGFLVPGLTSTTIKQACVLSIDNGERKIDTNGFASGAKRAKVLFCVARFKNSSAGDLIADVDRGNDCFIVDDEQVAKTNGTSTRSVAGKIVDVDSQGVWVSLPLK